MDKIDKQILVQEIKDLGFIKNSNRVSFPLKFGDLPKIVSIAWNEAREKVLDNYTGYDLPKYYRNHDNSISKLFPNEFHSVNILNSFIKFPLVVSVLLETTDSPISQSNAGANQLEITPFANLGTVGDTYDEIALGEAGASGNRRIGCYDTDGLPNNLMGESASFATETGYTFRSFVGGSFDLTTAQNWFAWIASTNNNVKYKVGVSGDRRWSTRTFGTLPDPALHDNTSTLIWQGKVGLAE
jgi:hypothetical protein